MFNRKIAVLSDIHGNYVALERCLEYIASQNIRTLIFLGDYIGELAYPEKTMQILYDVSEQYQCYFIKGNKEEYWLKYRANGETGWIDQDSTSGSLLYAYNSLTSRDLEFFSQLEPTKEIRFSKTQFMILHNEEGQWLEEFISLEYDVDRVIKDMQEEKLNIHAPFWSLITEHILRKGNVTHGDILSRAMQMCKEETGDCIWPNIPEMYWARAVEEIIG